MIERAFGGILFISSVATLNGDVVGPLYAVSKAALHGLTHFLAVRVTGDPSPQHSGADTDRRHIRFLPTDPNGDDSFPLPIR